jgi:hypothetical protein
MPLNQVGQIWCGRKFGKAPYVAESRIRKGDHQNRQDSKARLQLSECSGGERLDKLGRRDRYDSYANAAEINDRALHQ